MRRFVGAPLTPGSEGFIATADGTAPPVPNAFAWKEGEFRIVAVLRRWRSTKNDRGDTYLKRHWFELQAESGAKIEVYYDREARRNPWWIYTIDDER